MAFSETKFVWVNYILYNQYLDNIIMIVILHMQSILENFHPGVKHLVQIGKCLQKSLLGKQNSYTFYLCKKKLSFGFS